MPLVSTRYKTSQLRKRHQIELIVLTAVHSILLSFSSHLPPGRTVSPAYVRRDEARLPDEVSQYTCTALCHPVEQCTYLLRRTYKSPIRPMNSATSTAALLDLGQRRRVGGGSYAARFCIHLRLQKHVSGAPQSSRSIFLKNRTYRRDSGVS